MRDERSWAGTPPHKGPLTSACTETHPPRTRPPLGSTNQRPADRYEVGRVLATGEAYARPAHHKKGTKPRRTESEGK
ncbi:hypothetical protein GCM10018781_60450 [Kitasatospora indigofera]|uniref:Uncharacterized protein n=1 Tax=Kitasatospora indigofera TaxID=67307 RepID=A0A919GAI7_9ACTN|nr:hypothetical protein GCM10018781_60450 [Kitasatospora indigofera]